MNFLENGHIVFQPIWNIKNNSILGYEALLRCPGSPEALLQHAVDHHYISSLDAAIHKLAIDSFLCRTDQYLFLNCHPFSLQDLFTYDDGIYELTQGKIVLEITEIERISSAELQSFCKEARKRGCLIALDDFGAGYNNVAILNDVRPDFIKLDKSIMQQLDSSIIRKYVKLVKEWSDENHSFIIGEGIENKMQLIHCHKNGIMYAQGYLLGRPASWDAVTAGQIDSSNVTSW